MLTEQAARPDLADWRRKVEDLYEKIRAWTSEMEPRPTFATEPISIIERWSGEYQLPQLLIRQGEDEMTVRPVSRAVVGAEGRVDLEGLDGPFVLVLHESEPEPPFRTPKGVVIPARRTTRGWFWAEDRAPWGLIPLDGPLFRELAESCLR